METLDKIKAVKRKHEGELLKKRNVGVGVGYKEVNGQMTEELTLVVMVKTKILSHELDPIDRIPREIEGVRTDVKVVGEVRALS